LYSYTRLHIPLGLSTSTVIYDAFNETYDALLLKIMITQHIQHSKCQNLQPSFYSKYKLVSLKQ